MSKIAPPQRIQSHIYRIRGQQVMLDSDLADLYGVSVSRLNEAVSRNRKRFPVDFLFRLSAVEWELLRSQMVTSNLISQSAISSSGWGGRRHIPFAFTEQGVAMLASVLRSEKAILVNIAIVRTFVKLRHALLSNRDLSRRVEKIEGKLEMHDTDIRLLVQDVIKLKHRSEPEEPINPSII